jgi:hypothetical protein
VEPLLKLLEKYPDADFGAPGPVVHFVERFFKKGYEALLVASLKRKPTAHTLWMLNRIINGVQGKQKKEYVALMQEIADDGALPEGIRSVAKEFLE